MKIWVGLLLVRIFDHTSKFEKYRIYFVQLVQFTGQYLVQLVVSVFGTVARWSYCWRRWRRLYRVFQVIWTFLNEHNFAKNEPFDKIQRILGCSWPGNSSQNKIKI
jgi:hypothetical protein